MGDLSNEPSMEDILASIKKIISEDGDSKIAPPLKREAVTFAPNEAVADKAFEPAKDVEEDILDLSAEDEAAPIADEISPVSTPASPTVASPTAASAIVSADAAAASRSALASLSHMLVKPEVEGSDTLQGLVREMLKPMMKEWLDDHLPEVVERIVAQEVGRISGRVF
jgi:uncharacterized protein